MKYIQPSDRQQYHLMSSLDDMVSQEHPVRIIDKIVESIVAGAKDRFEKPRERETGRPRYQETTLIKLYLYGYFNGISSSRKLEAETYRNKEVIWLLGNLTPDHWTISNYRKENGDNIKYVTKKFREFLKDNGYIKLKTVAIDGSKVKAYTNKDMLTVEKIEIRLKAIDKKIEEYLLRIADNDKRDDLVDEIDGGDDTPSNKKYLDKIIELQQKLEQLQRQKEKLEKEGTNYISPSDPEASLMKSRDGKIPGYNVQTAVDAENKMIADSEVVTEATDLKQLPQMIASIKEELGKVPEEVIADRGYNNLDLIEAVEKEHAGIQMYTSQEKTSRDKEEIKFEYDTEKDEYICSEGKRLVLIQKDKLKRNSLANIYRGIECTGCIMMSQCTKSKKGRTVQRYKNQQWRDSYKRKMLSKTGKQKTSIRKTIVEHPFGTIKYLMGKIPLLLRGVKKVATEINIYTTVYNLKRLINIEAYENLLSKIDAYKWKTA
ncbi:MAG: IS1182 family transposase [Ignavibacteriaceae bacterium]|nr:IS1182 family transposase [Ignavibacteriaceae bacterium]